MDAGGRSAAGRGRDRRGRDGQARDGQAAPDATPSYAELARRERFTDALLETVEVGIVACDAEGTFVVSNRTERSMFDLDASLDGRPIDCLGPRIDVFENGRRLQPDEYPLMRALRGENVSHVEVVAGPRGGPYRVLVVRGRQITDADGRVLGAVAALTDVTTERAAARQLAEEHRRLAEAQRLGRLGSFEHDFAARRWTFSENLWTLWGLDPRRAGPDDFSRLIVEQDRPAVEAAWRSVCRRGGTARHDFRMHRATDGAARLLRISIEVDLDQQGRPSHARGTHLDITDLTVAETAAHQANAFFHAILTATPDCTFVTDMGSGAVIYVSPGKEVLGLDSDCLAAIGYEGILGLAHPGDRATARRAVVDAAALPDGEVVQVQYRARVADRPWRWVSQRVTPFRRDDAGRVVEVLSVVRDVTDVVDAEQRLVHAARHDYLTGLPNRVLLVERIEAALRRSRQDRREIAVLFCDLDGFKDVNDAGGHAVGDAVLTEVAHRLVAVVRDGDVVARMGGDEFVIVVEPWNRAVAGSDHRPADLSGRDLAHRVARRVVEALRHPVTVGDARYVVTGSVGIAYAAAGDGPAPSADKILHQADMAMYRAKQRGKDHVEVFEV